MRHREASPEQVIMNANSRRSSRSASTSSSSSSARPPHTSSSHSTPTHHALTTRSEPPTLASSATATVSTMSCATGTQDGAQTPRASTRIDCSGGVNTTHPSAVVVGGTQTNVPPLPSQPRPHVRPTHPRQRAASPLGARRASESSPDPEPALRLGAGSNAVNTQVRYEGLRRTEPKLSPEIIFLIRENAKMLESISLITRKVHEIERKVDAIAAKRDFPTNMNTKQTNEVLKMNGKTCTRVDSGNTTGITHHAPPNVLSDDSGGEYGRGTNHTTSEDDDELLSLLDKITRCSHNLQQTQVAVAAVSAAGSSLAASSARLPSATSCTTGGATGSHYSNYPLTNTTHISQHALMGGVPSGGSGMQQLNSDQMYQTARQTPLMGPYAMAPTLQFMPTAYGGYPPMLSAPPHHLIQPVYACPQPMYAPAAPPPPPPPPPPPQLTQQHPLAHPNASNAPLNNILFDPSVERFLNNLDQMVSNTEDRPGTLSGILSSPSSPFQPTGGSRQMPTASTPVYGQSASSQPMGNRLVPPVYTGAPVSNANTSVKNNTNWQLEKAAQLLAKKERESIEARYKMADDWLASCLARESFGTDNLPDSSKGAQSSGSRNVYPPTTSYRM